MRVFLLFQGMLSVSLTTSAARSSGTQPGTEERCHRCARRTCLLQVAMQSGFFGRDTELVSVDESQPAALLPVLPDIERLESLDRKFSKDIMLSN